MNLTELIDTFPEKPDQPITLVVYDKLHVAEAAYEVAERWGMDYLDDFVTLVAYKDSPDYHPEGLVYIDPTVIRYKTQWES